jgi:hypothetical protein
MATHPEPLESPHGNRWRIARWGTAAALLAVPAVAMQLGADVGWSPLDFATMGAMLFVACGLYELGARISENNWYRLAVGVAVLGGFLLVWINLAVGIIGSERNPANLMFAGVLVVGALGAFLARLRPRGMAGTMMAMSVAQAAVGMVALSLSSLEGFVLSGFFAAVWLASAGLFRKAAGQTLFPGPAS